MCSQECGLDADCKVRYTYINQCVNSSIRLTRVVWVDWKDERYTNSRTISNPSFIRYYVSIFDMGTVSHSTQYTTPMHL